MKKFLFILLLSLHHYCVNAQAYTYHPMPDSNEIWRVDWGSSLFCWPQNAYSKYQYIIDSDTIIETKTY